MATQITNYQCPACTAPLHFVGESGRLECDYCGSSFNIAEIEALTRKEAKAAEAARKQEETEAAQKSAEAKEQQTAADGSNWDTSGLSENWGADADSMKTYCCPSCGAELICDATTAATSCPYCGNPSVIPGQFSGILKPDFVLPFKLSKEDAIQALKKHYLKSLCCRRPSPKPTICRRSRACMYPSGCTTARPAEAWSSMPPRYISTPREIMRSRR